MELAGSSLHLLAARKTLYHFSTLLPPWTTLPGFLVYCYSCPQLLLNGHTLLGATIFIHLTNIYCLPTMSQTLFKVLEFNKQMNIIPFHLGPYFPLPKI